MPENQNPNQSRQFNPQRQTGRGAVVPSRAAGPDLTSMSGNAWANNDRGNREAPQQGPAQEQHVPVNGFNVQETRNVLKNGSSSTKALLPLAWLTSLQGLRRNTRNSPAPRPLVNRKEPGPALHGHQNVRQISLCYGGYAEHR